MIAVRHETPRYGPSSHTLLCINSTHWVLYGKSKTIRRCIFLISTVTWVAHLFVVCRRSRSDRWRWRRRRTKRNTVMANRMMRQTMMATDEPTAMPGKSSSESPAGSTKNRITTMGVMQVTTWATSREKADTNDIRIQFCVATSQSDACPCTIHNSCITTKSGISSRKRKMQQLLRSIFHEKIISNQLASKSQFWNKCSQCLFLVTRPFTHSFLFWERKEVRQRREWKRKR